MSGLRKWIVSLAGTAIAAAVSYQWFDRPIALFFHQTVARPETFARLTYAPDPMVPLAVTVFVVLGLIAIAFLKVFLPETKDRSLEELEERFAAGQFT